MSRFDQYLLKQENRPRAGFVRPSETVPETRVQFPRFQHEEPTTGDTYDREIIWHAEEQPWLDTSEAVALRYPKMVMDKERVAGPRGWWGMYHHTTRLQSLGRLFTLIDDAPHALYRTQTHKHEYAWNDQAIPGFATEVILERLHYNDGPVFNEVAALFVPAHKPTWMKPVEPQGQRLLMKDEAGQWEAPVCGEINDTVDYRLIIMSELAIRDGFDLGRPPTGNS